MISALPFAVERIDHVLLLVRGMDEALAFYEQVLGCTIESRIDRFGMAELRAGASHLDLVDVTAAAGRWAQPPVNGGRNVDHVCFAVHAHDEALLRAHLASNEVAIIEERTEDGPTGRRHSFYVRDPSDNVIELLFTV